VLEGGTRAYLFISEATVVVVNFLLLLVFFASGIHVRDTAVVFAVVVSGVICDLWMVGFAVEARVTRVLGIKIAAAEVLVFFLGNFYNSRLVSRKAVKWVSAPRSQPQ
jgi:hypothetical protein